MPSFQFSSFSDFLQMGGNAQYVWSVYFLFALFLAINFIPPLLSRRKIIKQSQARLQREVARK